MAMGGIRALEFVSKSEEAELTMNDLWSQEIYIKYGPSALFTLDFWPLRFGLAIIFKRVLD